MISMYNLYQRPQFIILGLFILIIWMMIWKGLALWYTAKNKQKGWFITILILNTIGILPIIYLIWFKSKHNKKIKKET